MASVIPTQTQDSAGSSRLRKWTVKIVSLVGAGLIFGLAYNWAAPRFYRPDQTAGFWLGALHGALMPVAAPSLLLGRDVPIYATTNTGRGYKLGYIAGINGCGLVFFGLVFWQPKRQPQNPAATSSSVGRPA
jgi:hypothetical protein